MNPKVVLKDFSNSFFSKRKKEKETFEVWMNSTYVIILSVITWLLLYYVWILNVNATKWYNIRQLEIERKNLEIEKQILDVKIAELESLSNILNEKDIENMEKVEEPEYLVIKEWVQYVYND